MNIFNYKGFIFVNLTPHDIDIEVSGEVFIIPKSGVIARRESKDVLVKSIVSIDVFTKQFGDVQISDGTKFPDPKPFTFYIVSLVVAQAMPERTDVLVVGNRKRNDDGTLGPATCFTVVS
jgi:hypothetical protein